MAEDEVAEATDEHSRRLEVLCPECGTVIRIADLRLFVLGLHQRVCDELAVVNGGEA